MARTVVGKVIDQSAMGVLVKAPQMVPIGTPLVDVRNQPAGRVIDVLGPVASPYLLVRPPKGKAPVRANHEVYLP